MIVSAILYGQVKGTMTFKPQPLKALNASAKLSFALAFNLVIPVQDFNS
jgi:hypothetical protein